MKQYRTAKRNTSVRSCTQNPNVTTTKLYHIKPKQQLQKTTNICKSKAWFRSPFTPSGQDTDWPHSTVPGLRWGTSVRNNVGVDDYNYTLPAMVLLSLTLQPKFATSTWCAAAADYKQIRHKFTITIWEHRNIGMSMTYQKWYTW